jgi:ABC-type amino acid transport substrate-binding protein
MWKLAIFVFFICASVSAKEKPLKVGFSLLEPFVAEKNGVASGLDYQFFQELTKRAKMDFTYDVLPMERFMVYAKDGRFDIALDVSGNPVFKRYYKEIPTNHGIYVMLVSKLKDLKFSKEKLIVGRARGYECPVFDEKQLKQVQFFEADSIEQGINLMKVGRIHAICSDLESFYSKFDKKSFKIYHHPKYGFDLKFSLFLRKTLAPKYEENLQSALKQLEKENVLSEIYKYTK